MTGQHENRREQYQAIHAIPITQRDKYNECNTSPNSNRNMQGKKTEIEKVKPIHFLDDLNKE